jgi:hypothetical protein
MIHGQAPDTMTKDQDFPVSIEVQLLGGPGTGERQTANLCTPGTHVVMNGKLHTQHCTNSKSKTYHGDQWVTVELEVRGNQLIKHIIDGETILEYTQPQLDEGDASARRLIADGADKMISGGTISLQSESHPVHFRKVEPIPKSQSASSAVAAAAAGSPGSLPNPAFTMSPLVRIISRIESMRSATPTPSPPRDVTPD